MNVTFRIALLLIIAAISCSKPDSIRVGGSTTVLPIVTKAAEQFQQLNPGQRVVVNSGGSGVAINQVGANQLHIGMISRDLTPGEIERHPGVHFTKHRIGRDTMLPVVSADVDQSGSFSDSTSAAASENPSFFRMLVNSTIFTILTAAPRLPRSIYVELLPV